MRISEMIRQLAIIRLREGDIEMELPDGSPLTRVDVVEAPQRALPARPPVYREPRRTQ